MALDWLLNSVETKPCPQQAMWAVTADWTEGNMSPHNIRVHTTYKGDTAGASGLVNRDTVP